MKSSESKNIIITGGSRGLGLSHALYLSKKGYNLAIVDLSKEACKVYGEIKNIDELLNRLSTNGTENRFYECDLTNLIKTQSVFEEITKDFISIQGAIFSAGGDIVGNDKSASGRKSKQNNFQINEKDHDAVFNRNYKTTLNSIKCIAKHFQKNEYGKIVTTSSISANYGVVKETAYSISKAAVAQLTRSVAAELRSFGINVNCIAPSGTLTGRFKDSINDRSKEDQKKILSKSKSILLNPAKPKYISSVVEFLVSDKSKYISGQTIRIDGGQITSPI